MKNKCCGLNVLCFGLALGTAWAIGMFVFGLLAFSIGWGSGLVTAFGEVYIGFAATFWGSILGAIWGFVDGFIFGLLIAWFYNLFISHCPSCCKIGKIAKTCCKTEETTKTTETSK